MSYSKKIKRDKLILLIFNFLQWDLIKKKITMNQSMSSLNYDYVKIIIFYDFRDWNLCKLGFIYFIGVVKSWFENSWHSIITVSYFLLSL